MKVRYLILIIAVLVGTIGCGKNSKKVSIDYESIGETKIAEELKTTIGQETRVGQEIESSEVVEEGSIEWEKEAYGGGTSTKEYGDYIYYITGVGIKKINRSSREISVVLEKTGMYNIEIDNSVLYYAQDEQIFGFELSTGEEVLIWPSLELQNTLLESHGETYKVLGFVVHKDKIYIWNTGISLLQYDTITKETQIFIGDVSTIAFRGNDYFYTDHAERTFSIYRGRLNSDNIELIRGDGSTYFPENEGDKKEMYDKLVVVHGELYYSKRVPSMVYKYNEKGKDKLIADFSNQDRETYSFLELFTDGQKLYYTYTNRVDNDCGYVYEYNPQTEESKLIAEVPGMKPYSDFCIYDNILFYESGDERESKTLFIK